ncbi:hypothetical protein [Streptomyces sp. CB03238]|uniref:hypothetical protein n=1 Tax=Streptomyces sp. CB03238 TaxID=1907777 RepID=UPI0015C4AB70|nr:hypothetical protein [Streptomyces sp. CB03238]
MAPWGQVYASGAEAWADCLLTGGLDGLGVVSPREQYERLRMLSPVMESAEYQVF